jgi:hypothetical protein
MRLISTLSYIACLPLFYKVLHLMIASRPAIILALTVFVFSGIFLRYGTELKQYMTETLFCTAMIYLSLKDYKSHAHKLILLSVTGAMGVFLSGVAPIILTGTGLALLVDDYLIHKRIRITGLALVAISWLVPFGIHYYCFIHAHPAREYMQDFWAYWGGFLPANPFKKEFYMLFFECFRQVTDNIRLIPGFKSINLLIIVVFALSGCLFLIKQKRWKELCLLTTPIVMHIALSMANMFSRAIDGDTEYIKSRLSELEYEKKDELDTWKCSLVAYHVKNELVP